jgi:hypothetical protein
MSDYIGDMFGYMLSNGSTLSLKDRAQKWYFTPGGEVRLKDDMTKCLSIAPGKYAHGIVVEKCNGSAVQKGWGHFYGKLRNESYPNGCVVAVKVEFMNHGARFEDRCSYNDPRIMWSLR